MALDFIKLDALRNRGCETAQQLKEREAQHKTREALLNKGFTCIDGNTPFSAPPETVSAPQRATPAAPETIPLSATGPATAPASAPQRAGKPPLKTQETGVNVSELLRDVFNFVEKYLPPVVNEEYWRANPDAIAAPPDECEYWERAKADYDKLAEKYEAPIYSCIHNREIGNIISFFYDIIVGESEVKTNRIKEAARAARGKVSGD